MRQKSGKSKGSEDIVIRWILISLCSITLYIQTNLADPINSPKQWVLCILAAWLIGYIYQFRSIIGSITCIKKISLLLTFFVVANFLAFLFTDSKYVAFFGDTQRRNGFITYLSLALVMLASALFFRVTNIQRLITTTLVIGLILSIYGLFQSNGIDLVQWNNPYNSVILTLGNPNFASAALALIAVISLSVVFNFQVKKEIRVFSVLLTCLLVFVIYQSNSRQGLVSFCIGVSVFLAIYLFTKHKKFGIVFVLLIIPVFIVSILGMLQVGPFTRFLYKPSVSIRGHYWRAAVEMFKENPFVGIGIDRYGAYFREFREVEYSLNYGWQITSSNAHNTFLQFFATGGILLGLSYLLLMFYVLKCAVRSIKFFDGADKLFIASLFAGWVSFQAQSVISIDNIGISIWNWILGGAIVGISTGATSESKANLTAEKNSKLNKLDLSRLIVSVSCVVIVIPMIFTQYRSENNAFKSSLVYNIQEAAQKNSYKELNLTTINSLFVDPSYALNAANNLISNGFSIEGMKVLKSLNQKDPRNLNVLYSLVFESEQLGDFDSALKYQSEILRLDPWDAPNVLKLANFYKVLGQKENSIAMLEKIVSFAPGTEVAAQAELELESLK
jgi:O-antigen ligase